MVAIDYCLVGEHQQLCSDYTRDHSGADLTFTCVAYLELLSFIAQAISYSLLSKLVPKISEVKISV
jgi:hypothetical protein